MRKVYYSWLLVVLLVFSVVTYAAEGLDYTDFESLYNSKEADAVIAAVGNGFYAADGVKDPYILYSVYEEQLFELAEEPTEKLSKLSNSLWLVPLTNGGNRRVRRIDGVWTSIGGRTASMKHSQEDIDMKACFALLNETLSETDLKDMTVYAIEVVDYATSFLICVTADETLVIPYSDATHLTHLENGKLYTFGEVQKILRQNISPQDPSTNGQSNGGPTTTSAAEEFSVLPYIGGIVIVIIAVAIWFAGKKRSEK